MSFIKVKRSKQSKMKGLKNKKALAVAGVTIAALGIGATIAYNQDAMFFNNLFGLNGESIEEYVDTFTSPSDWSPCQEIPKTATAQNKNSTVRYARMKIDEYWRTANSQTSADDHTTTDLPLTWDDNGTTKSYAIINTQNDNDWELGQDGWYYYKTPLQQNDITNSLLKSVTLNCDANLVSTVTYSQDGLSGESVPSAYAGATYHVYVTLQMSDTSWTPAQPTPHAINCDPTNDLLYDHIACASNGKDTGISYNSTDSTTIATKLGVNTLASSTSNQFPTYYYRGNVTNNNVIWADQCWKILHTTDTGGVKMFWMGEATNGQCQSTTASGGILEDNSDDDNGLFNKFWNYASAGYVYGNADSGYEADQAINSGTTLYFSNDVVYANGVYTLTDTDTQGTTASQGAAVRDDHHYTCLNGSTSCAEVAYIWYTGTHGGNWPNVWTRYVLFKNGVTVETFEDDVFADNNSSNAKIQVDNWFNTTIAAARRNDLEDTAFCNDRSLEGSSFRGKDYDAADVFAANHVEFSTNYSSVVFGPMARRVSDTVDLGCARSRDALTVASGKLTYPVALITYDEARLAGSLTDNHFFRDYGNNLVRTWTMSPAGMDREDGIASFRMDGYYTNPNWEYFGFNPVVSLKFGAKYTGTGTAADPFTISF